MVISGTLFDYLAAFLTILIAIALTDMLVSFHRLLRARRRVRWSPLPLLLAVFVFLTLLTGFFSIWAYTELETFAYWRLVVEVLPFALLFLAASAVLPDEVPEAGLDLKSYYFEERRYMYGVVFAMLLAGLVFSLLLRGDTMSPQWLTTFLLWYAITLTACLIGASARREWLHWVALTMLLGSTVGGFTSWSIEGGSALTP